MQCDIHQPFQYLADLMTIMEKKGRDRRHKKMVVSCSMWPRSWDRL